MSQYAFTIENLSKVYDDREILRDVTLAFLPGAKIGVLGNNGAGKSTLMRIIAGQDTDYFGEAKAAKGISIGYFSQEPDLDDEQTVQQSIDSAVSKSQAVLDRYYEVSAKMGEDLSPKEMEQAADEFQKLSDEIEHRNLWDLDRTKEIAKQAMRVAPDDRVIGTLSGGEKRRVALCRLLLEAPDILLLDEPTNHLDAESVSWLERYLGDYRGTVIAVTHDRYFLDNVAGWILEIERGRALPFEGNYSTWLEAKSTRLAIEERQESKRQKYLKKELEWVRTSAKARATKNKARLQRYDELAAEQKEMATETAEISIAPGPKLGDLVIDAQHLSKAFGEKLLYDDLSFRLPRGGIVGVIGPNGAGKTTLFRMITGQETPDGGDLKVGQKVKLSYVDQSRDALDPDKTVYEEISQGEDFLDLGGEKRMHARSYVSKFNFKGPDQQKLVGQLSGGERNRVHLAKVLKSGGNMLLLDEPTNDLDVDTLRSLEEALLSFQGCAMVSSHDRWFLDRVATHILAFEGDSKVTWYEGNFDQYERFKSERDGGDSSTPKPIKYRPLANVSA